jgi:DNA replication protein
MRPFTGFSTDKQKTVRVPEGLFEDVLPAITSMLEMKVTLHTLWRLARGGPNGSSPRMVSLIELQADEGLWSALSHVKGPRAFDEAVLEGLELALARGTLLAIGVRGDSAERWFLLNTKDNRAWVETLGRGEVDITLAPFAAQSKIQNPKSKIIIERPSIYALYEQNVGLLTPILAERLQDAEGRYPVAWIEAAIEEAVSNNKRSWRYIERILERWAAEGKDSGKDRGSIERAIDPEKYTKGKYAFLFRPDKG